MFIQRFPLFVLGVATLFSQAGPVFGAAVHGSQNDESGGGTGRGGGAGRLVSSCVVDKTIAMTFDDGPSESLRQLVDLMQASDAKGTIFINGRNYGCMYDDEEVDRIRYAFEHGFQVSSHTWGHKDLTTLSKEEMSEEMRKTQEAIFKITGSYPSYTRPPYGNYNDAVLECGKEQEQTFITWDYDSGDSQGKSSEDQVKGYNDLLATQPRSVLALNHDVHPSTVNEVLPHVLEAYQKAGYRFVTVAECLGEQPYSKVGKSAGKDASWKCD